MESSSTPISSFTGKTPMWPGGRSCWAGNASTCLTRAAITCARCCREIAARCRRKSLPAISLSCLVPYYLILGAFFLYFFITALAPEVSADGSGYHLGNVVRIWRSHGFDWEYRSMYSYLSQGTEMLFLVAFAFGRHSAAALVHFAFFCTL